MRFAFKFVFLSSLLLAALIVPSTPRAQSGQRTPTPRPTPPTSQEVNEGDVIRVDTELVTLTATVTDSRGRYVTNLKQSDFTVYEDGAKQELADNSYFNLDRCYREEQTNDTELMQTF
jgi:hypothetical protein